MRDLTKYPITVDEIEAALRKESEAILEQNEADQNIGDMRPILFSTAAAILRRVQYATWDIGKGLK